MLIGVSLKMYFDIAGAVDWSRRIGAVARAHEAVRGGAAEVLVLPSLPALPAVVDVLAGAPVAVGAQDLFWEDQGAFTGGVSGADLKELGCSHVEIGHVERRQYFGENDLMINLKLTAAYRNGLVPVLCVGERVEGPPDAAAAACIAQLESALYGVAPPAGIGTLVVAYEPEWAIGRAEPAGAAHVGLVAERIADHLASHRWLRDPRVIYGGSAAPGLLPRLGRAVQGLFLGRFAHDPEAFRSVLDDVMAVR